MTAVAAVGLDRRVAGIRVRAIEAMPYLARALFRLMRRKLNNAGYEGVRVVEELGVVVAEDAVLVEPLGVLWVVERPGERPGAPVRRFSSAARLRR